MEKRGVIKAYLERGSKGAKNHRADAIFHIQTEFLNLPAYIPDHVGQPSIAISNRHVTPVSYTGSAPIWFSRGPTLRDKKVMPSIPTIKIKRITNPIDCKERRKSLSECKIIIWMTSPDIAKPKSTFCHTLMRKMVLQKCRLDALLKTLQLAHT